jgi:predicted DNA-binding ribbon-helix-helix protein
VKSTNVVKRSVVVAGHKTSVSLEDAFWNGLKEIALGQDATLSSVVGKIDTGRLEGNLSSAIRLFVFDCLRDRSPVFAGARVLTDVASDMSGKSPD